MTPAFAEGLSRLNAIAAQVLRWSPGQFWAATPEELFAALADPLADPANLIDRNKIEKLMELERDG